MRRGRRYKRRPGDDARGHHTRGLDDHQRPPGARLAPDEALLVFSACVRDNGIDLPDIAIGPDGAPLLDPGLVDDIDIRSDEFTAAFTSCIPIIASSGAFQQTTDPEELAAQRDQLLGFSQCMRDEGIEDFPDPNLTGLLPYPFNALDIGNPAFDDAVETCQQGIAFDGFNE